MNRIEECSQERQQIPGINSRDIVKIHRQQADPGKHHQRGKQIVMARLFSSAPRIERAPLPHLFPSEMRSSPTMLCVSHKFCTRPVAARIPPSRKPPSHSRRLALLITHRKIIRRKTAEKRNAQPQTESVSKDSSDFYNTQIRSPNECGQGQEYFRRLFCQLYLQHIPPTKLQRKPENASALPGFPLSRPRGSFRPQSGQPFFCFSDTLTYYMRGAVSD